MFKERFKSHHDAQNYYTKLLKREKSALPAVSKYLKKEFICQENAIYIHIPFCDKICSFCNMNRSLSITPKDEYVDALINQISQMTTNDSNVISAIYFGGGTPTTLLPEHFQKIMKNLKKHFNIAYDVEVTCETTLHNLTNEHIKVFNRIGINRLSIGIQTFQDEGRLFFNRTYNKAETIKKIIEIKENFDGIICIDKIYNYPGETLEMLCDDVKQIIDLNIDSVSFYSLMIHSGSVLSKQIASSSFCDLQDQEFHDIFVKKLLESGDYEFIELTKIAKKNRDSYKYMSIRNNNGNTIPLGKGAGGKIDNYQIYNMDFDKVMVIESVDENEDAANEIYGLFQKIKVEKLKLKELFKLDVLILIDQLIAMNYVTETKDYYELTSKGIFYGNNIGGLITRSFLENDKSEK